MTRNGNSRPSVGGRRVGGAAMTMVTALGTTIVPVQAQDAEQAPYIPPAKSDLTQTVDYQQKEANRFIVKFQDNMATLDDAHKAQVINDVLDTVDQSYDANLVRQTFDGSYVVTLNPPVPMEKPRL